MSIYRGWKPHNDYRAEPVAERQVSDRSPPVHLRKAQPLDRLLPRTSAWIASLPHDVQPHALARQFARIANQLCATWDQPTECRKYLGDLLVDKRGQRKGFTAQTMNDLVSLARWHAEQYPTTDSAWPTAKR